MYINLDKITLARYSHASAMDGTCLMEAIACIMGESFSDRPACVSATLRRFGIKLNDAMVAQQREMYLKPLIPLLIDTAKYEGRGKIDWHYECQISDFITGRTGSLSLITIADVVINPEKFAGVLRDAAIYAKELKNKDVTAVSDTKILEEVATKKELEDA